MIRKVLVPIILFVAACAPVNRLRTPAHETQWPIAVSRATLAADSGSYGNAERILATFAAENPGTREAREIVFWRAMFKLDPGNTTSGSLGEGLNLLNIYLADPSTVAYRAEAKVVRRLAITTQILQAKAMTLPARDTTIQKVSNEAEVAALRAELARTSAELARTSAELDRIKKRLANPN
ncbi:MAG: hypothetical protein H0W69_10525, partial [Gemmatimonadaceae bacterium]|nr:hypothetical protein [Gemmatimonadaceae bacterium]